MLKKYLHICNFPKSKFPKILFTNFLKNLADLLRQCVKGIQSLKSAKFHYQERITLLGTDNE